MVARKYEVYFQVVKTFHIQRVEYFSTREDKLYIYKQRVIFFSLYRRIPEKKNAIWRPF